MLNAKVCEKYLIGAEHGFATGLVLLTTQVTVVVDLHVSGVESL